MVTREEMEKRIGKDLTKLIDEIIDKSKELEAQGIDMNTWDGWGPYKERLDKLNSGEIRLVAILGRTKKIDPQQKIDGYLEAFGGS